VGDVVPFRRPRAGTTARGKTLCREGFHKWEIWKDRQFDVKAGKLITVYRCARCGATQVRAH
jgi:hypothetical protein